ncbi:MAG: glycoside hydrolase family 3 N-terminal domain-containing protein, partial [Thalassobaculaceae bacterium]
MKAIILGLAAERLSAAERRFFQAIAPAGFILFKRNCQSPEQVRALTGELRDCLGWAAPILIDQEGGRVQRLAPPVWAARPAPGTFRAMAEVDVGAAARAAYLNAAVMAAELSALGIDVNCVPDLDLAFPEAASAVVGDRSYGDDPVQVVALGRAVADGTLAGGALPVIKHLPGHGRGVVDSHFDLPRIDAAPADLEVSDFLPFRALADLPLAMTGHLLMSAYDTARPATTSPTVIERVIRGWMGFDGLLMSDDL